MNKKDYVDAMNEIEPRESLKKETYNKATKPTKKYKKLYPILSAAAMAIIAIGIGVPLHNGKELQKPETYEIGKEESVKQDEEENLQRLENFENLYAMLEKSNEYNRYFIEDAIINVDSATNSTPSKGDTNNSNQEVSEEKNYSKTNTQEENVDEADIVKTDGNYIYYLSDKKLTITAVDGDDLKNIATIEFKDDEYSPRELFIKGNKLILIGNKYEKSGIEPLKENAKDKERKLYSTSYKDYTVIKVYDIANKEKPEESRTVEVEGYYISSRMIDNNIYLISNKNINAYLCKNYAIDELNEDAFKIQYIDTALSSDEKCIDFTDVRCIPNMETPNYLNVVSFNVDNNEEANIDTYLGAGTEIYSSEKNLYVTKANYEYETEKNKRTTEIYKFNLVDGKCKFQKTGEVPGTIINQFSMSEDGEYFRIATTDNDSWKQENNTNNLYVLNNELEIVGKIEGLAKGEKIYSVRFMGNRAYMVTFVETDPLFVIDLKDPTNPTVLGELKIPGYSKYLHPYDENHLIGFGENTKVVNYGYGDRVVTDGMKMALFDVTDPNNPKEMYSVDIGDKGTYSELLYNHKALLFSKEKNIIAFPISVTEGDYEVEFQGAIVYGLTLENGFELRGKISHMKDNYERYHSENRVERIIYIGDNLFTLSGAMIKATNMNSMQELSSIDL